jgi:DNA-directed RNA polymerase subunit RPC12/RpoP
MENAKTKKGEALGWLTGISYLAPANESGVMNTCQFATDGPDGCIGVCIYKQGRGQMPNVVKARIAKTVFLHEHREDFLASLRYDIGRLERSAAKLRFCATCGTIVKAQTKTRRRRVNCRKCGDTLVAVKIAVRINGTSDLAWIPMQMSTEFPHVQFYDYTKLPKPHLRVRSNYAITFSHTGKNLADCMTALANGVNVAVAFAIKKGKPLPETWFGYPVIDGDTHDLRFLDATAVVVGLRGKGVSWKQPTAFMVDAAPALIQIALAA